MPLLHPLRGEVTWKITPPFCSIHTIGLQEQNRIRLHAPQRHTMSLPKEREKEGYKNAVRLVPVSPPKAILCLSLRPAATHSPASALREAAYAGQCSVLSCDCRERRHFFMFS